MLYDAWKYSVIYLDSLVMYTWCAPRLIMKLTRTLFRKLLVWTRRSTARKISYTYQPFCQSLTSKTIRDRYVVVAALAWSFHYIAAGALRILLGSDRFLLISVLFFFGFRSYIIFVPHFLFRKTQDQK